MPRPNSFPDPKREGRIGTYNAGCNSTYQNEQPSDQPRDKIPLTQVQERERSAIVEAPWIFGPAAWGAPALIETVSPPTASCFSDSATGQAQFPSPD